MVEYLLDVVRATSGEDIGITANLTNCAGLPYETGCSLRLFDGRKIINEVKGLYMPDTQTWSFVIPAEATRGLYGRYWYEVVAPDMTLDFKTPIYLK